jgi:hypothetical protein
MDDMPESWIERAQMLESILLSACEGKREESHAYHALRQVFTWDDDLAKRLPDFVRTSRTLDSFWAFIKPKSATWAGRRQIVRDGFIPLFEHLEGAAKVPVDEVADDALASFDAAGVHAVWRKAVARRHSDPDGAITSARTLLETICKRVLDKEGIEYDEGADLPTLYKATATALTLHPTQHTEDTFKRILGGCTNIVESLGTLRNKIGDAHGKGGRPVKVLPRHAQLAVNMAGAAAVFIAETWLDRQNSKPRTKPIWTATVTDPETGDDHSFSGENLREVGAAAINKLRK